MDNEEREKDHEFVRRLFRTRGYMEHLLKCLTTTDAWGDPYSAEDRLAMFEEEWAKQPGRPTIYDHDWSPD